MEHGLAAHFRDLTLQVPVASLRRQPLVKPSPSIAPKTVQEQWHIRTLTYRMTDALAIVGGWALAMHAQPVMEPHLAHTLTVTLTILLFHFVGETTGMYRNWRGVSVDREVLCTMLTWAIAVPLVIGVASCVGTGSIAVSLLGKWLFLTLLCMAVTRVVLRLLQNLLRARGVNTRGFAIVGVNELAFQLAENIRNSPEMGMRLVGFFDDRDQDRTPSLDPRIGQRLGDLDELLEQARARKVHMIYITFPMRAEDRIRGVLEKLADTTASVYLVPDFFVFELLHSRWTDIGGLPTVSVFENPFYGVDGFVKRCMDVALASVLLLVCLLPMLLFGLLIKWSSPGPVFFRQRRYGLDGREILVWKFRSMRVCEDGDVVRQATRNDDRTTPIGAFLRQTSLDELPQLFNVLNGTMSLVGPRPHATAHNEEYRSQIAGYMLRHKVRPGITGLAQVRGYRGETDTLEKMERRVECDHQYIREWSLLMDLKILFRTIFVVFSKQNAY